jgi:hypothetical protein
MSMIVEFVGGPDDGKVLEMPGGSMYVNVAGVPDIVADFINNDASEDDEIVVPVMKTMQLPIRRRQNGTFFVMWTERWDG